MTTSTRVPLKLIRHQGPMLATLGQILVGSVLPIGRRKENPEQFEPVSTVIDPLPDALVDSYVAWSGTTADYSTTLPPHMFSQWAMPVASQVLRQSRYPLAGIINQGVTMKVNGELRRGEPIHVQARLASLEETEGRARLSIALDSGTAEQPDVISAVLHVLFPLPGKRPGKQSAREEAQVEWDTVGTWRATGDDGLNFAVLTGDFNPIHWIGLAGKLSPFGRKVLHGFGMFVRSVEALASSTTVGEIDVRFLKPVPLPSEELAVQQAAADEDGWRALRLVGSKDAVHLVGRCR